MAKRRTSAVPKSAGKPSENGAVPEFRFAIGPETGVGRDKRRQPSGGIVLELPEGWRDAEIFDDGGRPIGEDVGEGRIRIEVQPLMSGQADDEVHFNGHCVSDAGRREFTIVVRRTRCRIETALLGRGARNSLHPQTEAALLWYGWGRYRELCGLKRFGDGLSGAEVVVLRPMLSKSPDDPKLGDDGTPVWGSCLLVKSGNAKNLGDEWKRFQRYLADRLHPFMAKTEELLEICPAQPEPPPTVASVTADADDDSEPEASASPLAPPKKAPARSTLVGSFLGGDLFEVESFTAVVRGTADTARCIAVVDRLASILAVWHAGGSQKPLGNWSDLFGEAPEDSSDEAGRTSTKPRKIRLADRFELDDPKARKAYAAGVAWDVPFLKEEHLNWHLLGKPGRDDRGGLLHRLAELPVRFSLVHGDLHLNNLLVGGSDVWLLDFGATWENPTLFDFAKLEVYLRLWCLDLHPPQANSDAAAHRFEELLLDHMTGSTGGFESVCEMAHDLGTTTATLHRISAVIARIRKLAIPYGTGYPDRRDYVAVLYMTVLQTIQYAAREPGHVENYRLLMTLCWLLEDTLSRLFGMEPYPRTQVCFDHRALLTPEWIAAPGAPARLRYAVEREDGRLALAPLAATRGVLQSVPHHLDVFDHTLLVIQHLETMIHEGDPVADQFDPARLDRAAEKRSAAAGVRLAPPHGPQLAPTGQSPSGPLWGDARIRIKDALDEETRLVLKWGAVFHDVGKPATRQLSRTSDGRERIMFIGHELYGRRLASGHLKRLFPAVDKAPSPPRVRRRIGRLIRGHHTHHQWIEAYRSETLQRADRLADLNESDVHFFAELWEPEANPHAGDFLVLFLHGFADSMAARGPAATSIAEIAAIDREVLRHYVLYMQARKKWAATYEGHVSKLRNSSPKMKLSPKLRPWFLWETDGGRDVPYEKFAKKANQMAGPRES